ncbi:head-tail adaptor protein [Dysgonomonas sp. GY617]|uniref:phage head completion protein n=1 Tax=Dysgonomonas sp. GY617 TaxID=2780420 RepID=UPI0018841F80|nr:head-tail adaptor protein [Dysgonomonas sp. GY617]MBF0577736.1 head-tail adaptor protein [Dysgonomonas sp. GY617]
MRAGLLTETIDIYEPRKITLPTGEVSKEYFKTRTIKAYRKKLSASVGSGINASEEFIANTIVFQTRVYSFLNEDMHIKFGNRFYSIVLLDKQRDNTYLITASKNNE